MGKDLEQVDSEKDIGVTVDSELSFDRHISVKVKKATSMFAVITCIFHHLNEETFIPLYKSLVRTHLDYGSSVWAPYRKKHVELIEGVQRRATKQLPGMKNLTYAEHLRRLKLPTLSYRRVRGDLIEVYKIISGKYDAKAGDFIKMWADNTQRTGTCGNSKKLFHQRARLEVRRHSFNVLVVQIWNSLPDKIVCAKSQNSFKNKPRTNIGRIRRLCIMTISPKLPEVTKK